MTHEERAEEIAIWLIGGIDKFVENEAKAWIELAKKEIIKALEQTEKETARKCINIAKKNLKRLHKFIQSEEVVGEANGYEEMIEAIKREFGLE